MNRNYEDPIERIFFERFLSNDVLIKKGQDNLRKRGIYVTMSELKAEMADVLHDPIQMREILLNLKRNKKKDRK